VATDRRGTRRTPFAEAPSQLGIESATVNLRRLAGVHPDRLPDARRHPVVPARKGQRLELLTVVFQLCNALQGHQRPLQCLAQLRERRRERLGTPHRDDHQRRVPRRVEGGPLAPTVIGAVHAQQRGCAGGAVTAEDVHDVPVCRATPPRGALGPAAVDRQLGRPPGPGRERGVGELVPTSQASVLERDEPVRHDAVDVVEQRLYSLTRVHGAGHQREIGRDIREALRVDASVQAESLDAPAERRDGDLVAREAIHQGVARELGAGLLRIAKVHPQLERLRHASAPPRIHPTPVVTRPPSIGAPRFSQARRHSPSSASRWASNIQVEKVV
jgi:hypothetical protein